MSSAGLSKSRLERMHQVLSGYVQRQELSGLVALVSHHDDAHEEALGTLAFGDAAPMQRDTIFRLASLTKPITAVAAMLPGPPRRCGRAVAAGTGQSPGAEVPLLGEG